MVMVTVTTELPMSADAACALATKPELFRYLVQPILRIPAPDLPDRIEPGAQAAARLWWFGVVPTWMHHLTVVRLGPTEIYTNEHGGPVRTWNHRLTFTPTGENSCRYTDEVEIEDGWRGIPIQLFAALLFRYRQRRWRALARVLA
ncbi:hypothetical protein ACFYVR_19795 [Rhodococcus sp. NPDC003318]|uniref:hypothetical protein n=1 Tax=Rhodococcus sp. NPDC003318 TaxID=3364503 RepID=UPI0036A4714C